MQSLKSNLMRDLAMKIGIYWGCRESWSGLAWSSRCVNRSAWTWRTSGPVSAVADLPVRAKSAPLPLPDTSYSPAGSIWIIKDSSDAIRCISISIRMELDFNIFHQMWYAKFHVQRYVGQIGTRLRVGTNLNLNKLISSKFGRQTND